MSEPARHLVVVITHGIDHELLSGGAAPGRRSGAASIHEPRFKGSE